MERIVLEKQWVFNGGRVRKRRKKKHLTQKQLAEMLNLTQSMICEYETGKSVPSLKNLPRLAVALNTSIDYLFGVTDFPQPTYFGDATTETEKDLLRAYYALPLDKRERAVGFLIGLQEG